MPDARLLFERGRSPQADDPHRLPPMGGWAASQKVEWAADHFPGRCNHHLHARDKHKHMRECDVLVDDREKHRAAYEAAAWCSSTIVQRKTAFASLRRSTRRSSYRLKRGLLRRPSGWRSSGLALGGKPEWSNLFPPTSGQNTRPHGSTSPARSQRSR